MSSTSFNVIRRHSLDSTGVRIKELTQALATARSKLEGSQLETDDVRSQGRMDHSTIKVNDERLKFATVVDASNTDFFYELPKEPDLDKLKVWLMLDHLGTRIRDISGFQNDAYVSGHPTLRRALLNLGFGQLERSPATAVMVFNSGTDVVSQTDGEYIWIPDNESIQFTNFENGFSIHFRFNCLDFLQHYTSAGGSYSRRFASKTDDENNGWSVLVYAGSVNNSSYGGVEFEVMHNGVEYARRTYGYSSGLWYQTVVTYDPKAGDTAADRIKMYTGGIENSVDSTFGTILSTTFNLRIGARSSGSGFFHGYIHDFRLWMDQVLTQEQVTHISDNELTTEGTAKGHVFVIQYALVQQVIKVRTHKWIIIGKIIKTKVHRFRTIALVTSLPKTHKYSVIIEVTALRTHKFTLVELVQRLLTLVYNQGGEAISSKTHKWNTIQTISASRTHKYSIVKGLETQYVRFQKNTTAGSNITQEVTYTSTPQALIVWSDGNTADNTFADNYHTYYGFSDGTHHACVSGLARDNLSSSDTFSGHKNDKVIAMMDATLGAVASEATVSFGTNKATFNWTTNDNRAVYIHTLALWGINKVEVKTFTAGTTTTGNRAYSLNDSTLVPKFIHTINRNSAPTSWSTAYSQAISISAAKLSPTTKQFAVTVLHKDNVNPSDNNTIFETSNCAIVGYDPIAEATTMRGALSSLGTGTFTINWTDAPASTTAAFSVLTMDSPNVGIGTITQRSGTGTQVVTTDTNVDTVKGLMMITNGQVTIDYLSNNARLCIGGASGTGATDQGLIIADDVDGESPTISARQNKTGKVTKSILATATATSTTTQAEASVSAIGTDQFTLDWSTADTTARKIHYIVWGTTPT